MDKMSHWKHYAIIGNRLSAIQAYKKTHQNASHNDAWTVVEEYMNRNHAARATRAWSTVVNYDLGQISLGEDDG